MILFAILLFALIALLWMIIIIFSLFVAAGSAIGIVLLIVLGAIAAYILTVGLAIKYLIENRRKGDLN